MEIGNASCSHEPLSEGEALSDWADGKEGGKGKAGEAFPKLTQAPGPERPI